MQGRMQLYESTVREYVFLPCLDTRASVVMEHHWLQVVYDKIVTLLLYIVIFIFILIFDIVIVANKKSIFVYIMIAY